jgi:hypothetical protein
VALTALAALTYTFSTLANTMMDHAAAIAPDPSDADVPAPVGLATAPLITVEYEYISPANVDDAFLARRLDSLRTLPIRRPVSVIVTSDMAASHAARVRSVYSDPFSQSRVGGRVTAKVVATSEGHGLLVDAYLLLPDVREHTDASVARTFRHEGLHAVLRERGEDTHTLIRSLRRSGLSDAQYRMRWIAALALEEFRIERALNASGEWRSIRRVEQMQAITRDYYDALAELLRFWGGGIVDQFLSLFCELASQVAHGAAETVNGVGLPDAFHEDPRCSELVCRSSWNELVDCLRAVPDAFEQIAAVDLTSALDALSAVLERWLADIGYLLGEDADGLFLWPSHLGDPSALEAP